MTVIAWIFIAKHKIVKKFTMLEINFHFIHFSNILFLIVFDLHVCTILGII